jgi:hypothetical protein
MYSDVAAVTAVPAGAAGVALFAPGQVLLGLALLAMIVVVLATLTGVRSRRLSAR